MKGRLENTSDFQQKCTQAIIQNRVRTRFYISTFNVQVSKNMLLSLLFL